MLAYPNIDPVAIHLGPLAVHWYGLMYLIGILGGWALGVKRSKQPGSPLTKTQVDDLIFYAAIGLIIGGRMGYMLFYDFGALISNPLNLFMIWNGGMSFHGGLIGAVTGVYLLSRKINQPLLVLGDFFTPLVPIGLGAGRIGNFINGELWGKVSDVPWAMIFPTGGPLPRHPSQLYEAFLEGAVLFTILWIYSRKPRGVGAVSGLFLILYSLFRFTIEFVRVPDVQLGYLALDWLTMGQILSLPMLVFGIYLMRRSRGQVSP